MPRPSYTNVTATLALVAALATGGAYAADKIGSRDIARNAVRGKHVQNGSLKLADLPPITVKRVRANPAETTFTNTDPCAAASPATAMFCGSNPGGGGGAPYWHDNPQNAPTRFSKAGGIVHLSGHPTYRRDPPGAVTIFILPTGYRPDGQLWFDALCSSPDGGRGPCLLSVESNGRVGWADGASPFHYGVTLDGVSFLAK